ncbi:hypothetical protein WAK64_16315 [Bacillus spongiae]|uniref:Uncharacterized protein n=1 Tax=Bacillus spongiae TaxID=2683610 RepID=A0ABU8HGW4_9BACI
MMFFQGKYKLSVSILLLLIILLISFKLTSIPTTGFLSTEMNEPKQFKFGYIRPIERSSNLEDLMKILKDVPFIAGADRIMEKEENSSLSNFYPIYDEWSTDELFNERYTYLPHDMTGVYGRSVYSVNYGDATMIFLRTDGLQDSLQLDWLKSVVHDSSQMNHVVFVDKIPKDSLFWEAMNELGIHLIISENELLTRESVVVQEPSDWSVASEEQWGVWNLNSNESIHYLLLEMNRATITVKAINTDGRNIDQMQFDVGLHIVDGLDHTNTLVPIQSLWYYHEGSDEIKTFIHENFDMTGETPITDRYPVPTDDWRSVEYDQSNWKLSKGPFGYRKEPFPLAINQALPSLTNSVTYYFRKTFDFHDDLEQMTKLFLHMTFEDGYVAYLNGEEISRDGMKTGLVTHQTVALPNEPHLYDVKDISNHKDKLVVGENTISVEVHSSHPKSPNFIFDMSLTYERKVNE